MSAGSVGNRQCTGSDSFPTVLPADVRRIHRTLPQLLQVQHVPPVRSGLRSTGGVRRPDRYHLGHGPRRCQQIHCRLQTVPGLSVCLSVCLCIYLSHI